MSICNKMICIVRAVGLQIKELRDTKACTGEWHGAQLKTEADLIAHRLLVNKLREINRDIPVVSEEDPESMRWNRAERYWLIDPIDGTASLAGGFSGYVTQVAMIEAGTPVLAAIYAPENDEMFYAEKSKGAFLNDQRLLLARTRKEKVLIDNYPDPRGLARKVFDELNFDSYIESGSISLKICRIADSTADLFVKDVVVRDWDVAAPHLILTEVGGCLRTILNKEYYYQDSYEKPGIVASRSQRLNNEFFQWWDSHSKSVELYTA